MNKQELIESVEKLKVEELFNASFKNGFDSCKIHALHAIEKLDEPELVEVSQFVADWFEANKDDLEFNIWNYIYEWLKHDKDEFKQWMDIGDNKPLETLLRMKQGYTVKPKQWVVKFNCEGDEFYFNGWSELYKTEENPFVPNGYKDNTDATVFKFTDKSKADTLATLIDGSVEEV